ncbi:MAG TPA: ATP-binding protein, partial [Ktedonobacteraceae bacterium]|nr:ATP-binding protein [Ktedonobacteraceae bacterium]
ANQAGCGPANSLKLSINPEPAFFESLNQETKLESSLQGGKTTSIPVSLLMTEEAVRDKIFSLSVSLSYRTYMADICTLGPLDFSIQLGATEEFQRISNPYDASGGVARQGKLFYGRDAFIEKIIDVIDNPGIQHKSIVIYGQMRSGKTSILQHLLPRLEERNSHILAANLESVGGYQNIGGASIFTKLLWDILQSGIQEAIQRKIDKGFSPLALELPSAPEEFFHNPAPERYFISIVKNFLRHADNTPGWEQTRIILGLDEFQYIYGYMQNGNLPPEFMIYWKALLQENLLSTILVGQDVMPKFIERYSNEFGVMEKFPVTYLSEEHAKRLIDEPIFINGKSRYREQEAIDSIFQLTAGNPYYIQIICSRLVEHLNEKKHPYITRAHVKNVCESLMKGNQKLHSEFDNLIMSGDPSNEAIPREDARAVLKNIARESRGDGYCPREEINCQTTRPIDNILEDLYVRKVVEKHERFFNKESQKSHYDYKIIVELYKEWLLANA